MPSLPLTSGTRRDVDVSVPPSFADRVRSFSFVAPHSASNVTPGTEILLVGTGKTGLFPPPKFKQYLNSLGIQVDVLDSVRSRSLRCDLFNM